MRLDNVAVVAKREYLQRIKGKAFWIGTLILPLFLIAVTVLPSLLLAKGNARQRLVVVDATGEVAEALRTALAAPPKPDKTGKPGGPPPASFEPTFATPGPDPKAQQEDLDRQVRTGAIDAWIWVDAKGLETNSVQYHAKNVANFVTQEVLRDAVSAAIRRVRLERAGFRDTEKISELTRSVQLETIRIAKQGSRAEGGMAGFFFAYVLFMMLYTTIAIWGQQVMTGVLEEKGSRIVEVLVSTVRPFDLLLGKLVGICLLGLTQIVIWFATLMAVTAPGIVASLAFLPEGVHLPTVTFVLAINFAIFFVLGFFVFATFYAAIGASFNNLQEAQQVAAFVVFFLIAPLFIMFRIVNDPDSTLAVVSSLIPPFTPLLMTLRVALQPPPFWQLGLSYLLTLAFILGMVWMSARIYRTGILMYGKKPTLAEIWRWVRYA
jgi:ABC-2 type transport system permease protein